MFFGERLHSNPKLLRNSLVHDIKLCLLGATGEEEKGEEHREESNEGVDGERRRERKEREER